MCHFDVVVVALLPVHVNQISLDRYRLQTINSGQMEHIDWSVLFCFRMCVCLCVGEWLNKTPKPNESDILTNYIHENAKLGWKMERKRKYTIQMVFDNSHDIHQPHNFVYITFVYCEHLLWVGWLMWFSRILFILLEISQTGRRYQYEMCDVWPCFIIIISNFILNLIQNNREEAMTKLTAIQHYSNVSNWLNG